MVVVAGHAVAVVAPGGRAAVAAMRVDPVVAVAMRVDPVVAVGMHVDPVVAVAMRVDPLVAVAMIVAAVLGRPLAGAAVSAATRVEQPPVVAMIDRDLAPPGARVIVATIEVVAAANAVAS